MQRFDLSLIAPSPWKNGGGSTREIACFPPGAAMDQFGWRISVATIAQAGPFSAFAGIDRQIMLLEGDGVQLTAAQSGIDHALDQRWKPFAFSGDVALDCQMLGGTSTDFNVMTRRGQWAAQVDALTTPTTAGASNAGLVMVLQGAWQLADGTLLHAGQGLCWQAATQVASLAPHSAHAHLVQVTLTETV